MQKFLILLFHAVINFHLIVIYREKESRKDERERLIIELKNLRRRNCFANKKQIRAIQRIFVRNN